MDMSKNLGKSREDSHQNYIQTSIHITEIIDSLPIAWHSINDNYITKDAAL